MATPRRKSRNLYGISRVDDDVHRTHAWRVSLKRQGKTLVKNFPDKKHGGKRKALAAAKQQRDEWVAKYPPLSRKDFAEVRRRHNRTGITGVFKYSKKYTLQSGAIKETWYWEAQWPTDEGDFEKQSFSVSAYGEAIAKQMAITARQIGLEKLAGHYWATARRMPSTMQGQLAA